MNELIYNVNRRCHWRTDFYHRSICHLMELPAMKKYLALIVLLLLSMPVMAAQVKITVHWNQPTTDTQGRLLDAELIAGVRLHYAVDQEVSSDDPMMFIEVPALQHTFFLDLVPRVEPYSINVRGKTVLTSGAISVLGNMFSQSEHIDPVITIEPSPPVIWKLEVLCEPDSGCVVRNKQAIN